MRSYRFDRADRSEMMTTLFRSAYEERIGRLPMCPVCTLHQRIGALPRPRYRWRSRVAIDVQIKNENLRAISTLNRLPCSLKHYLRSYSRRRTVVAHWTAQRCCLVCREMSHVALPARDPARARRHSPRRLRCVPQAEPVHAMRDALGAVFADAALAPLFPAHGQPAHVPLASCTRHDHAVRGSG